MHRSVELELEEVDCIQDQQLLQKANVSPFFTSSRPPFIMLSELDFSPQAISRAVDDIAATAKTTSFHTMPPLSLDCSSFNTSSSYSTSSLSSGSFDLKPLSRASSWQDLSFASQDQSPGRFHGNANQHEEHGGYRNDALFSPLYEYHRNGTLDCLPSLYDDGYCGREKACEYEKSEMFEHQDTRISPFKDDFNASEPAKPCKRVIVTESDLKLFSSNASSTSTRGYSKSWESSNPPYLVPSAAVFRPLEIPRFRREKLFPQQNDNGFLVPKSSSTCSTAHQITPFPMESLNLTNSEPKRHNAFRKQSPLPDAHRTSKTKRASKDSPYCKLPNQSPMTELTKKCSRATTTADSFPDRPQLCRLPGLQQSHTQPAGLTEFGIPSSWQAWHRGRHAQFPLQHTGYYGLFAGFPTPSLQPQRVLSMRKIGAYSPEARQERIKRFHEKRKERVFHKRIKYDCRKRLANACPRIKGRFVRKQDLVVEAAALSQVLSEGEASVPAQ